MLAVSLPLFRSFFRREYTCNKQGDSKKEAPAFRRGVWSLLRYCEVKFDAINGTYYDVFDLKKFAEIKPAKESLIKAITKSESMFRLNQPYSDLIKKWDNVNSQLLSQSKPEEKNKILEEKNKIDDEIIANLANDLLETQEYIEHIEEEEKDLFLHYLDIIKSKNKSETDADKNNKNKL